MFLRGIKQEEQGRKCVSSCRFNPHCSPSHGCVVELSPGAPTLYSEAAAHLKKLELETVKTAGPWPALHINLNKVPGRLCMEGTTL